MAKECKTAFWRDENILKLTVVMDTQLCEFTKSQLYIFNEYTACHVDNIPIKVLKNKSKTKH